MNRQEAAMVLRKVAAFQPNQRLDALTADAWAEALADVDCRDALDAVTAVATAPRPEFGSGPVFIEVRDVITEVARVRRQRVADRKHQVEPPREVADDPAAYQRWLADTYRAMEARDWNPPKAIEYPARPVGTLIGRIAAQRSA